MKSFVQAIPIILLCSQIGTIAFARQSGNRPVETGPSETSQGAEQTASPARPAHPISLEQTREMFDLMHFRSAMQSMLHANLAEQRQHAPFIPEGVWQDFEQTYSKVDFARLFLPVYQKYLSQEDAARAIEFYRTPAGQHTLAVMPALMQDIARVSENEGEEIAAQVFERHRQEIDGAEKKYNQPAAPPANSPSQDQPN